MRISDWSSDVCSSDLIVMLSANAHQFHAGGDGQAANDMFLMKPVEFNTLLDVISSQLTLEWTGPSAPHGAKTRPRLVRAIPAPLSLDAQSDLAEIERLVRTGHIRGIEAHIQAIAGAHPELAALVEEMRTCLDSFDLEALAAIARARRSHAG